MARDYCVCTDIIIVGLSQACVTLISLLALFCQSQRHENSG